MRHIAALPACSVVAGAAAGLFLPEPHTLASLLALTLCAIAMTASWASGSDRALALATIALFGCGGATLGAAAWQRAWRPPLRVAFEQAADERGDAFLIVEGTLRADAEPAASGVSLSVDVDRAVRTPAERDGASRARGGAILTVVGAMAADRMPEWRAGRRVRVPATLRRPSRYLDPGVRDNERAVARRGTTLVGTVKSGALVEVLARGSPVDEALASTRAFARRAIADAVGRWDPQAAAIVAAIVIGDRAGLDPDVERKLQEAGTYHVIAISGGNIAILAGLLLGAFRLAGWLGRTAMAASIALLIAYAMLVGGGASVDRATLMASLYLAGRACDHRAPPLNTLALAAGLLVAADPLTVADPAFLLTFGATLAILVAVPAVTGRDERTKPNDAHEESRRGTSVVRLRVSSWLRGKTPGSAVARAIVATFLASLAAEVMLFPVAALVFARVTFAGLALNFAAIPLMAVAQIAGMAVVPAALASKGLAAAAGSVAACAAIGLVRSADLVRLAPAVAYRVAAPSGVAVAIYYVALATWWSLRARRPAASRTAAAVAACAAVWILLDPAALTARHGDGRLHVTFIDVGQGDSTLVRLPAGTTLLVDAGGLSFSSAFDVGDRVVAPVLRMAGVYRIDYLALTHGDPDHIGGAASIVREFRPREVWEGIPVPTSEPLTALRMAAQRGGARWANVYAGDRITRDGVDILVRHPEPAAWERQKVRNDDSVVLELRWRDVSILLTGDIGRAPEAVVAAALPPSRIRILKAPHHGSLTSSGPEFLAAIRPQFVIVSVGRGNRFGHPAAEVLDRYRAIGAETFRTDRDGAVFVDTDGTSVTATTFLFHPPPRFFHFLERHLPEGPS